jgi:hydroxyacylglutathione hydrolase
MKKEDVKIIELTFVNAFLVKSSEDFILIDTGLGMFWQKLESELISAGCLPKKLKLVIITHGDQDHVGNCAVLQQKYGCKIAMHASDVLMAEKGVRLKRKVRTTKAKIFMFIRRLRRRKIPFDTFRPDIFLTDDQRLDEYGLQASVIHIPGHTKGSIGILTDEGSFFAGDIFVNRKQPDLATYIENSSELKSSYARLKKLSIKTVYPGHGKPFEMKEIMQNI